MVQRSRRGGERRAAGLRLEPLEARETPATIGSLDPSFGSAGTATTAFTGLSRAVAVALQPDGKVVVAGTADTAGASDFAIARYNPDGTLDATFSNDGMLTFGLGGVDVAAAVAVQPDGKIVVAGYTDVGATGANTHNFALIRVTAAGAVDTTFDGDGIATVDFGFDDRATGVAVQADGKIVVVGSTAQAGASDFAVARLTTTGTLDATFNGVGGLTVDFGGLDAAAAVALRPDGTIVVAGTTAAGAASDFAVARLTAAGALDATFNTTGKETVDFAGGTDTAAALALQSDGRIVVVGSTSSSNGDFAIARLLADGGLDPTFSDDGRLAFAVGGIDAATGVAVQPDGKLVVVGTSDTGVAASGAVVRFTAGGLADATFSDDGQTLIGTGTQAGIGGVALTPTGRVVVAGGETVGGVTGFATSRLIGTVERGRDLAVGGSPNGTAAVYSPAPGTSGYGATPVGLAPFGTTTANVRTAVGDVNGDGIQDTVLVTGPGTAIRVAVISGADNTTVLVQPFDPFGGNFTGGGFVAVGDFDNDGRAEFVVTPDQGGGPRVSIFSLLPTGGGVTRANFLGIDDANFRGGARAATGDVNGDGVTDLILAAGFGGGPRVALFNGASVLTDARAKLTNDFFVFDVALRNGVFVAGGDVDGDGFADLIVGAGPGGAPRVLIASGKQLTSSGAAAIATPLANFFVANDSSDRGGVRVVATDVDGDTRADVVAGSGDATPSRARVYPGYTLTGPGEPTVFQDINPYSATLADGVYVG